MAFNVTLRTSSNQSSYVSSKQTASFTPAANSQLFVWTFAQGNIGSSYTLTIGNSGGLSFGSPLIASSQYGTYLTRFYLWRADVGGSPSSMTVTLTSVTNTSAPAIVVFDVTGASTTLRQSDSNEYTSGATLVGGPMTQNAVSGNLVVCLTGINNDSGSANPLPSGFTSLSRLSGAWEAAGVSYRTDFSAAQTANMTSTDSGNSAGTAIFELELAGGTPWTRSADDDAGVTDLRALDAGKAATDDAGTTDLRALDVGKPATDDTGATDTYQTDLTAGGTDWERTLDGNAGATDDGRWVRKPTAVTYSGNAVIGGGS